VGNISGKAEAVPLSGAVTIDTGLVAIVDDAVTTAKILDGTILAADIAADAATKILDGTILR
jgi:cystathionine beta-lyase/cystathionine gamma-synthase